MARSTQTVKPWGSSIEVPATLTCPICHTLGHMGAPALVHAGRGWFELVYICPAPHCAHAMLALFRKGEDGDYHAAWIIPTRVSMADLPGVAGEVSPDFVAMYKEAEEARQRGLRQICGPGFRKAFEFLIKDYAKQVVGTDAAKIADIEKTFSADVVKQFISDERVRSAATRALWLGNDESHYLRKWTEHDIDDLLNLIRLTLHWMEIERLSSRYEREMPGPR